MGFGEAIKSCFNNYVTFSGRAPRSEYWFFVLFSILGSIAFGLVDGAIFGMAPMPMEMDEGGYGAAAPGLFGALFSLAIFLPSIAVAVRRLHDVGRSGWWWWLWFIPIIGWIVLLVWNVSRGTQGDNAYGPDPLMPDGSSMTSIPKVPRG